MNPTIVFFVAGLALAASSEIIQGPSVRTINAGPSGHVIDSIATGGAVIDGPVARLVSPSLHAVAGVRSLIPEMPFHYVEPGMVSGRVLGVPLMQPSVESSLLARSYYESSFYRSGVLPMPYKQAVISGPSGTIVADHP